MPAMPSSANMLEERDDDDDEPTSSGVSRFGLAVSVRPVSRGDLGSNLLRLSFLFKLWSVDTVS